MVSNEGTSVDCGTEIWGKVFEDGTKHKNAKALFNLNMWGDESK